MRLLEVKEDSGLIDVQDNQYQKAEKSDTRRPRLTLAHLSKLRKMREIRKMENEDRKELFSRIYARSTGEE